MEQEELGHLPAGKGCNLYEEHRAVDGWESPRFITTLAAHDNHLTVESLNDPLGSTTIVGDWVADMGSRTAEVTPDGRHLVFESTLPLTGYDVSSIGKQQVGEGGTEIFRFSADDANLSCVSCDPRGLPPTLGAKAYTYIPVSSSNTFMRRWMNDEGTEVFFDSSQPLTAGDGDGVQDVYEWEAQGGPSCPTSTSVYGGCLFLLSGGQGDDYSYFVDADESGSNVFLTHRGQLGGVGPLNDKDHLYDVHASGGFVNISRACTGTGCQGVPPAAPSFATPASVTFSGAGNFMPSPPKVVVKSLTRAQKLAKALKACRKDRHKPKRVVCERQARKHYGPVRSRSGKRNSEHGGRKS
jgi:hypothetical protein